MKKKIIYLLLLALPLVLMTSCEENLVGTPDLNHVSFEVNTLKFGVDIDGENTNTIAIYAASKSASARTVEIVVVSDETTADAASYTVPTSVTIPANSNVAELSVTISDLNISSAGETLTIGLVSKEGLFVGGNITINVQQVCPTNGGTLEIGFDGYPEEVYWDIKDAAGTIVATSNAAGVAYGGHANEAAGSSLIYNFCWDAGTYTFRVFDQYADGGGAITIIFNDAVVYSTDGVYGAGESASFTL